MSLRHRGVRRTRHTLFCFLLLMIFVVAPAQSLFAISANPNSFQEVQPDGTVIALRLRGDENFNWAQDLDGYTVVRDHGWFEYARLNPAGRLVPSGLRVGQNDPRANGLKRGLMPNAAQRAASAKGYSAASITSLQAASTTGQLRNLVVLIRFSNHTGRSLPTPSDINVLLNAPGGDPVRAPTGSVRDIYLQNSYGQLELDSDTTPWIAVSGTEQYYANGVSGDQTLWQALQEALTQLDQTVDFRDYDQNHDGFIDAIAFLHSGYGAEWGGTDADGTAWTDRIWSHQWVMSPAWVSNEGVKVANYHISPALWSTSGTQIGRVGVIAHETGHFLGLPDLYDTDGGGAGIGSYGLMANSWGFDGSQLCPPQFSPWSKLQLGWISPTTIAGPGTYSIGQSATSNEYFVITQGFPANEYLMIENRQRAGLDCALPQGGLAIWHIDDEAGFDDEGYPDKRWPKDGHHYRVALAQADGNFQMEKGLNRGDAGDVHHAGGVDAMAPGPGGYPNTDAYQGGHVIVTGHTVSNVSASAAVMTFCLNGCGDGAPPAPSGTFDPPSDLQAALAGSSLARLSSNTVTISWTDNSSGDMNEDEFIIERCEEKGKSRNINCNFSVYATVGQDVTSFSEPETSGTFRYRVKARRGANTDTAYSNEVRI